ncbi:MAG: carbamoyl-phosphate synthase, large subunit, partial [Frankiales bacterium]|nr:carbamoyl-phosphate synthase, large subunit [Frankiales bacterium]
TMKSVGEAMSIGRSFVEALQKAMRSLEQSPSGFWAEPDPDLSLEEVLRQISTPTDGRLHLVELALRKGATVEQVFEATKIDRWFLDQILQLVGLRAELEAGELTEALLRRAKRFGCSDKQIAAVKGLSEQQVRALRHELDVRPVYKTVDTCAAEFAAETPYHYSSYDEETEVAGSAKKKVLILGSGPNRIGQGIEFDYACVHASFALRDAGYETVMVNCNPETVSTDYDTSDRLYFEPLTVEDVLEVVHAERLSAAAGGGELVGVIVQLGGQTPLRLAQELKDCGVPIVGTSPEAIHLAEDRDAFGKVMSEGGLPSPKSGMATSYDDAATVATDVGYPVLVRPSYVLGGRGMEIVYSDEMLRDYMDRSTIVGPDTPVLVDRFLEDAIEIDVDALYDGTELYLGGVMEHIEEAGIHSGDSACALPPITLGRADLERIRLSTEIIAKGVGVRGLLNVQYALKDDVLYVLEANPRASRTVPFTSKATAVQLAKACARVMLGTTIAELRAEGMLNATGDGGTMPMDAPISVKEAVLPFGRFRGVDTILGPEMKSTGEVMGIDAVFGTAFAKSQSAAYGDLPLKGKVFVSVANRDKRAMIFPVKRLADLGFEILATEGTAEVLRRNGVLASLVGKHSHGLGDDIVPLVLAGEIDLIFNTPFGVGARLDGYEIRTAAVTRGVPCITTIQGAAAAVQGIEALVRGDIGVTSLQEHHARLRASGAGSALAPTVTASATAKEV